MENEYLFCCTIIIFYIKVRITIDTSIHCFS
eukprot:UN16986